MKIGCVTRHLYPTAQEIRVTKFASTFTSKGHDVYVFCPGEDAQKTVEVFDSGTIVRLKSRLPGSISSLIYASLPFNPVWMWWFFQRFRQYKLNIVIVRDLRLALPVFVAARVYGIKAILDIGEHYPGMMEVVGKQNLAHYIIRNHWLISKLEALSVSMADYVWVVVEENRKRLLKYSSRIDVINNYPVFQENVQMRRIRNRVYSCTGEPITLISLGLIDNIRGLDIAIEAFSILVKELDNVQLKIYGDGFFRESLERQVSTLGLEGKVIFGGWVNASKKYEIMTEGDIGLILHKVCDLTRHTVPNKLFDYMSVGLPIVSTPLEPIMRILDVEQCGSSVREDAVTIASVFKNLILDENKRKIFSGNGYKAAHSHYRWDSEELKIMKNVNTLVNQAN